MSHWSAMLRFADFDRHPVLTPMNVKTLSYDPKELLESLSDDSREEFERQFPSREYSEAARHRALVLGSDNETTGWWLPRQYGVFYLAENGERRILGPGIPAFAYKGINSNKVEDASGRLHYLHNTSRAFANRKIVYGHVEKHICEPEWNRPLGHKYHFQSFPGEIRELILSFALLVKEAIEPKTILCSWTRELQLPGYTLAGFGNQVIRQELQIQRRDNHGPYTELRMSFKRPLDATCLRVNRQFQAEGARILYGRNTFDLSRSLSCVVSHNAVYTMNASGKGVSHRATKPSHTMVGGNIFMQYVDIVMRDRRYDDKLPGWMFCDPFVRFLRTIGPKNSASLRDIYLPGRVMENSAKYPHVCQDGCKSCCLVYHLRMYGPFVKRHCKNLRALELRPQSGIEPSMLSNEDFNRHLFQILRAEIFRFPTLTELRVIGIDGRLLLTLEETRQILVQSTKDPMK